MRQRSLLSNTRGEGKGGCIFSVLFLLALAYLGYKIVPPIFANYQFQDAVNEVATFTMVRLGSRGQVSPVNEARDGVLKKAMDLEIPLEKEDITVKISGERILITVNYSVPIELPGYTYNMDFTITSRK